MSLTKGCGADETHQPPCPQMAGTGHAKAVREPIAVCVKDAAGLHGGEENRGDTLQARKYKIAYPVLERWMVENRFTPRMIAQEIGKHKQTVLNWLYGVNYPKLPDVWALVKLTDIPFEQLFREK